MPKHKLRLAALLIAVVQGFAAQNPAAQHVRNFGEVNEHLYRGGEPTQRAIEELAALHINQVIDLREPGEKTKLEQEMVEAQQMNYINIPLSAFHAPDSDQIRRLLWLLVNGDTQKIFVHCRRGADRTGTVVACYRIEHDGWDNRKALAEAHQYGMSSTERGMRSYILHFSPVPLSALAPPVQPGSVNSAYSAAR
jgi:tyrosine-protein phosphatase SIW14